MKVFVVDQSFFGLLYDVQFCAALAEAGADVTLVGRQLRPYEEMTRGGFRHLPLFYSFSERLPARLKSLARMTKGLEHARGMGALVDLVRRERPDILHFQWIVLPFIDARFLPKLAKLAPLVLTVHNSVPYHGAGSSSLMLRGQEEALGAFHHFIPHTAGIRDYLRQQGIADARIELLSHPAVRLPRDPEAARRAASRPPGAPVEILFFGNMKPYKGVDILIGAVSELSRRRRDFHVTISGKASIDLAPLKAELAAAAADELVTFEPRHLSEAELGTRLEAADIVVFPYREIDASGAFACASQFGKPILASDLGAFAEAPVRDHLRLVAPEDPAVLAAALEELIADPGRRAEWATRSRSLQQITYSWERFAEDCMALYGRMLSASGREALHESQQ